MAELTDETTAAQGFSMLPVATALAYMIGFGTLSYHHLRLLTLLLRWVALLLVVSYPDHKIAGRTSSPTLSGPNTRTFCRA